jgi:hypothetical protein
MHAFAGRYGEDKIRHSQVIETVKNAKAEAQAELQNAQGAKGGVVKESSSLTSPPFRYSIDMGRVVH